MTAYPDYDLTYQTLLAAIKNGPHAQIDLLKATDATYAYMEEAGEALSDDEVLGLRVLLGEAETILGRYFGM